MKKFCFLFILVPSLSFAAIFESSSMMSILEHVEEGTLVAADFDNTLTESEQQLGTVQWGYGLVNEYKKQSPHLSAAEIYELVQILWKEVHALIKVRCVDSETLQCIQALNENNMPFIVLTARRPIDLPDTQAQITYLNLNIHPDFNQDISIPLSMNDELIGLYEKGVLYCNYQVKKGDALEKYLELTHQMPKKIIFIDDRMEHVINVGEMADKLGIEYVGLRFSGADERVKAYRHDVAQLQYQHLPKLLSDEEALQILSN